MRVGLISDTHAPRHWTGLPVGVARAFDRVDVILHAGDVCTPVVLDELSALAPVHVALGNNDGSAVAAWGARPEVSLTLAGVRVVLVHEAGAATGRGRRLARRYPDAGLVVFGHSHVPWDETTGGQRAVNPGSPTDRRRQPTGTVAVAELSDGRIAGVQRLEV